MHYISKIGNFETAQILINNYSDINIKNKLGHNPLHIAYYESKFKFAKFLIKNGAVINYKEKIKPPNYTINIW